MLTMDQIHHIRALFYEQGKTISDIAAATKHNWKTVAKYVDMKDFNQPKPSTEPKQLCPKLDPYKSTIDQWIMLCILFDVTADYMIGIDM